MKTHEHTGSALRPSLRNGFTAYFVLSPARPGLFVTVARKKRELLANLTPAIGASGPHDFAVRVSRARQSQLSRPSLPDPRFRDECAYAPLVGRDAQEVKVICLRDQAQLLRHIGTTGKSVKCCQDLFLRVRCMLPHPEERRLRRVSKDGVQRSACGHPSRLAPDSASALPGELAPHG
jgi:hypothetical protein